MSEKNSFVELNETDFPGTVEVDLDANSDLFDMDVDTQPPAASNNDTAPQAPMESGQTQGLPPAAIAAMKDERSKRQALEEEVKAKDSLTQQLRTELAELRGTVQALAQPKTQEPQEFDQPLDWANLDKWSQNLTRHEVGKALQQQEQRLTQERQQELQAKISASIQVAKGRHEDYMQVAQQFDQLAQSNPRLASQFRHAPDPAEFAYQYIKQLNGGPLQEENERLKAELAQLRGEGPPPKQAINLAGARGSGTNAKPTQQDVDALLDAPAGGLLGNALDGR